MKKTIKPGRMTQQVMSKYCVPKQRLAKMVKSSSLLILLVNVQMIQSKFQLKCLGVFFGNSGIQRSHFTSPQNSIWTFCGLDNLFVKFILKTELT
jgi:hypothetical protein